MDPVNEVLAAFSNQVWKGAKIPVIPYSENYIFQGETMFSLVQNSDMFPAYVNGKRGRGSGGKIWRQTDITINAKYYETVVVTRFQKPVDGRVVFLFHAKIYKAKQTTGQSAVKKLKREVESSPNEYVLPQPTFSRIDPTSFSIVRGKREVIRITGERLKASAGRLEKIGGTDQIFLFISNSVDRTQITAEFHQPEALTTSSYLMYLVIYDQVYKFENPQQIIQFTDQIDQVANALFSTIGNLDPIQDPEIDFFLSPHTLTQAIELGNTRCVAMLSQKYNDGHLPTLVDEAKSGEKAEKVTLNQPVILARKSGNMCTLLFVIVWNEVSKGRRELSVLNKLREHVLQTKNLTVAGMLLSIKEGNENNNEYIGIESKIRASLAKPKITTATIVKKAEPVATTKGNQKTEYTATSLNNKLFQFKLVLLGESAAGKSSLVLRFVKGHFLDYQESTIGAAFLTQTVCLKETTVKFEIWDTAGQERYHSLAPMYYRGAQAAIVVYDITNYDSFERAKKWVKELQRLGNANIVIALAGNKVDLASKRAVDIEESQAYADDFGLLFMETSAKTAVNVNELFVAIANKLPKSLPAAANRASYVVKAVGDTPQEKAGGCCG